MGAVNTHLITAPDTIQKIGDSGAVVPEHISMDKGVVDIYISNQGSTIKFAGRGLETNVGKRIPSTTQGMSIPAIDRPTLGEYYPAESVSRLDIDKEPPPRKGEQKGVEPTVQGISRPQIAEDTKAMVEGEVFDEPIRGLSDVSFLDEDEAWKESLDPHITRRESVHRPSHKKKTPRRRDDAGPTMGGMRI